MKTKLLFTIVISITIISCQRPNKYYIVCDNKIIEDTSHFHIMVVPFGDYEDEWVIHFTNDNFETFNDINENLSFCNVYQTKIFDSKQQAINLAKILNTYNKCLNYNKKQLIMHEGGDYTRRDTLIY
jgi:hypothetical protein